MDQSHIDKLKIKLSVLLPELNEKQKRYAVALEAKSIGWGGIKILSQITGMSQTTIRRGLSDLNVGLEKISGVRKKGGGRKKLKLIYPELVKKLETIIDEATRGDPETPLRWTCKSVRNIADLLSQTGKKISHMTVCRLLHALQFSLKGNKKTKEGNDHPDRDKQFRYIAKISKMALNEKLPVISVDTKKKELVGNFKNGGREWSKAKKPIEVNAHDFPGPKVPQARPFGVYDIGANKGWVSVGVSADTAEFAVNSIRGWWRRQGCKKYLKAKSLLIFADAGGSNGYRLRLWKSELQKLANHANIKITVCHFPPGTSKWNKIEHRLFSFISINWRGKPLLTYQVIIELISATKNNTGLTVNARLDKKIYKKGIKISNKQMEELNLQKHKFHGEWNYTISPIKK